ncbi:hypothetical protein VRB67_24120 [Pseudomonas trivialis]|uniref:hypothetical protein n=2 Tax=Pseudomonas trivialis TaxID=200450 RepID=UPI0030D00CB0
MPGNFWVDSHQMSINGKRDNFGVDDLLSVGSQIKGMKALHIIREVHEAVRQWPAIAAKVGVSPAMISAIAKTHRLNLVADS